MNILRKKFAAKAATSAAGAAASAPTSALPAGAARLLNALIMMVDDEPLVTAVTQLHLQEAGYSRFISTTEPLHALPLIVEKRPDLLLLDLKMPGMSGFEILTRMEAQKLLKDVPTIVLTASTDAETKRQVLRLGASDFLTKPVDPSELALRVRNTLAAKAYWEGAWEATK